MKVSTSGREIITAREGRRLAAYQDTRGIWTIGVGHAATGLPPHPHAGMTITAEECDALLAADLAPVEAAINGLGRTLTQNQFDALASLVFNIGVGGFLKSSVATQVKAGNMQAAADALLLWERPPELRPRREAERHQFLTPDAPVAARQPSPATIVPPSSHPVSTAAPAAAKPPAPVAAAPASIPAAAKATPMSPTTATAKTANASASVNVLAGLTNTFETMINGVESSVAAAFSKTTAGAVQAATSGNAIVGSISDGEAAVADVKQAIADARAGKWGNEPADILDFATHVLAILSRFGVVLPGGVNVVVSALKDMVPVAKAA